MAPFVCLKGEQGTVISGVGGVCVSPKKSLNNPWLLIDSMAEEASNRRTFCLQTAH